MDVLLSKHGGCQNDALASLLDSRAQEKRAQVLLHCARTDVQFAGNFFVAATLDQQLQHFLIAAGDFDPIKIQHFCPPPAFKIEHQAEKHVLRQSFAFAYERLSTIEYSTSGFRPKFLDCVRAQVRPFREFEVPE